MKDIFVSRAKADFSSVLQSFIESLRSTFPDCEATKDWALWYDNLIKGDDAKLEEGIRMWADSLVAPLRKGSAKYMKAVQSITEREATVYHSLSYRDADAANASSDYFRELDFPSKLKTMDDASKKLFWEYMDELTRLSMVVMRRTLPPVPTPKSISDDIEHRKYGKAPPSAPSAEPMLQQGALELWKAFCVARGGKCSDATAAFSTVVSQAFHSEVKEGQTVAEGCKKRDMDSYLAFQSKVPDLKATKNETPLTEEEWVKLEKIAALCTMETSIPAPMMRGIEGVAARLMEDIASGKTSLDSLNVEAIGNEVLSGVSSSQIDEFAKNMDKILPALQQMK